MVVLASIPRSGNTFLRLCLESVLGKQLRFCESHDAFSMALHNVVKVHDFKMSFLKPPGFTGVLQYREPVGAIYSWFDTELIFKTVTNDRACWETFYPMACNYYNAFVAKWLPQCSVYLDHATFMANPEPWVRSVIVTNPRWQVADGWVCPVPRVPSLPQNRRFYTEADHKEIVRLTEPGRRMLNLPETI